MGGDKKKIGRNDPCPCGSGLKYKKCHGDESGRFNPSNKASSALPNDFLSKYNSLSLLKSIAALSVYPKNHGKYFRMEQLTINILKNFNENMEVPTDLELEKFLDSEYSESYMEDPPVNFFCDVVSFHGLNYFIFPGITENSTFILSNLFKTLFQWSDPKFPKEFYSMCYQASKLILEISNSIAKTAKYNRYQHGEQVHTKIDLPSDALFDKLRFAINFNKVEIMKLLSQGEISPEILKSFIVSKDEVILEEEAESENSVIINKPFYEDGNNLICISPSNLSFALTEFIKNAAKQTGCYNELVSTYHKVLWEEIQIQLFKLGFRYENVPELGLTRDSQIAFYQFDDDKLAVIYLKYTGQPTPGEGSAIADLVQKVLALSRYKNFNILNIPIISSIGDDFFFPIKGIKNTQTLVLKADEVEIVAQLKEANAIDLYKFTLAEEKRRSDIPSMASFIDRYKFYKENNESFYFTDDNPEASPIIFPGYGAEYIFDSKTLTDQHSAVTIIEGERGMLDVIRKDKWAPVYLSIHEIASGGLNFLVDGFKQPVWVHADDIPHKASPILRQMYFEMGDAVAYWIWQVQEKIVNDLAQLDKSPLIVSFRFENPEKFESIDRNFERTPDLLNLFKVERNETGFTVGVPDALIPYLYGSDNEGERILLEAILNGFNETLTVRGLNPIDEQRFDSIINECAPFGIKKKVFIIDTAFNLLIDPRNLKDHRYITEFDTSVVLDQIVPRLGNPRVGELISKKEKNDLAFNIVQKSLLPLLRETVLKYNSTELLKRLLGLNESLIRKREELKIKTPTRIACFVTVDQHLEDLAEEISNMDRTSIAVRCLIEHVAAEPTAGSDLLSKTAIDELVAIMDQIISWGSLGDQIHYDLIDLKMAILASGRVGTSKSEMKEIFDPFHDSKTGETIKDAIDSFESVFPGEELPTGKPIPDSLDKAFKKDFGISFTRICDFITGLAGIGFLQSEAWAVFELEHLRNEINKNIESFNEAEFDNAINFLSITARGNIENLPAGFEFIDIMPWRFNRMLSLLRRPLIIVEENGTKNVYWGPRQVLQSRITLASQCISGRFRGLPGTAVINELGKFANERGDELVKNVLKTIDPNNLIIDQDVYIRPGSKLQHTDDFGDVDILIIDPKNKVIYSLECKSMAPSRNVKEMIEEVGKLFGDDKNLGWVEKHMRREKWLRENLEIVGQAYNLDLTGYSVKSFFVTEEEMLTPHLRKEQLPLPFVTRYDFEREGNKVLTNSYDHQLKKENRKP
jgi:hypothetical protein